MMNKKPLAVYIHIPFCEQKCRYCDFLSGQGSEQLKLSYFRALMHEIGHTDGSHYIVTSVYIGGGTPSCVQSMYIVKIMDALRARFEFAPKAEISMEMNPGTVRKTSLADYKAAGINRLSIGLQSTHDDELRRLGRIHDYRTFLNTYELVRSRGFDNVNIDLMSSLPKQTMEKMEKSLERVIKLGPEHISVYSLIIEEGTPFYRLYEKGELELPDEDTEVKIDRMVRRTLLEHGYERYEISNFARPGYECRHNLVYWSRGDYLGFGIGAASLLGHTRFSNTRNIKKYIEANGMSETNVQKLTVNDEMGEFMFLGLRKVAGVKEEDFENYFGKTMREVYGPILEKQLGMGMLTYKNGRWAFTEKGMDVSNTLMADYLLD
ncbi:MAG: radical SAM family heme chaperone HemW [Lachnospiraceae bacterium]|nr:radical SAM family heme chaperone HemW [Lachnospiraceae bacterium]